MAIQKARDNEEETTRSSDLPGGVAGTPIKTTEDKRRGGEPRADEDGAMTGSSSATSPQLPTDLVGTAGEVDPADLDPAIGSGMPNPANMGDQG